MTAPRRWGPWVLDVERLVLTHEVSRYEVDIERMPTTAQVLDTIAQVSRKEGLFTDVDVGHFVRAVDELLDLQALYCSMGVDKTATKPVDVAWIVRGGRA